MQRRAADCSLAVQRCAQQAKCLSPPAPLCVSVAHRAPPCVVLHSSAQRCASHRCFCSVVHRAASHRISATQRSQALTAGSHALRPVPTRWNRSAQRAHSDRRWRTAHHTAATAAAASSCLSPALPRGIRSARRPNMCRRCQHTHRHSWNASAVEPQRSQTAAAAAVPATISPSMQPRRMQQ